MGPQEVFKSQQKGLALFCFFSGTMMVTILNRCPWVHGNNAFHNGNTFHMKYGILSQNLLVSHVRVLYPDTGLIRRTHVSGLISWFFSQELQNSTFSDRQFDEECWRSDGNRTKV